MNSHSDEIMGKNEALGKIMREFMFMWILTGLGMIIGSFLPPLIAMIVSLLSIVLLIVAIFVKKQGAVNKIFYLVPLLLGVSFYYSVNFYLSELGSGLVIAVLGLTVALFIALGFFGMVVVKKDLGFMGQILFFALLGLIIIGIVAIFVPSFALQVAVAGAGVVIFCLYTLYDFNQIAHREITPGETVGHALGLYLDFLNLFLDLLRLVYLFVNDD